MKKKVSVALATIIFWGAAIVLTFFSIRIGSYVYIPSIWILLMVGWAESINIVVHKQQKRKD